MKKKKTNVTIVYIPKKKSVLPFKGNVVPTAFIVLEMHRNISKIFYLL